MPHFASGVFLRGRGTRALAGLITCAALLAPLGVATAQSQTSPSTDNNQLALAGTALANRLRITNNTLGDIVILWDITSDGTGGAALSGPGDLEDTAPDGDQWAISIPAGGNAGPTLTLGSSEGSVTISACPAQLAPPPRPGGTAQRADYNCAITPVIFTASTASLQPTFVPDQRIDRGNNVFVEVQALNGGSTPAAPVAVNFNFSGPAVAVSPTTSTSDPANFQVQVDTTAADNELLTITATRADFPAATFTFSFQLSEYLLVQTSPADGTPAPAGSTITLTVDATRNGLPPDNESASRTIEWEIIGAHPPGTQLTGGGLIATSQTQGTTATIDLTIGAPNFNDAPVRVRATAFESGSINRGPFTGFNVRTVDFDVNAFDVLSVNAGAGDGQSADVGDPVLNPFEVTVLRNGASDAGRQVNWSTSPANAVTFAGGAPTATSTIDVNGLASITITSVNTDGAIQVIAAHADRASVSDSFTVTGTAPILALSNPTGDGQSAPINTAFAQPLGITANRNGTAETGAILNWSVNPPTAATLGTLQTTSGPGGLSSNTVTAGATGGPFIVRVARNDDATIFYEYTLTAVDRRLTKPISGSGDGQSGLVNESLAQPLVVIATDNGAPVAGVPITWTLSGDADLDAFNTVTGPDGRSSVNLQFGPTPGTVTVLASRDDAPGTTASFVVTSTLDNAVLTIEKPADSGDGTVGAPGTPVDLTALTLRDDEPDPNVEVNWSVIAGQGRLNQFTTRSNSSGITRNIVTLPPTAGTTRVRAARADRPQTSVVYLLTAAGASGDALTIVEGNSQTGAPGTRPSPLGVLFTRDGVATADIPIAWSVTSGSATLDAAQSTTGVDGVARIGLTFGGQPGAVTVRANTGALNADFSLEVTGSGGGAISIRLVGGAGQTGAVGTRADQPLTVEVLDDNGDPLPDRRIEWVVTSGSATLDFPVLDTDANGRASQGFTFGPVPGPIVIRASLFAGVGGGVDIPATSFMPTLSIVSGDNQTAPVATTLPQDFVVAIAAPVPRTKTLAGVPIRWTIAEGGGTLVSATTVTDVNGRAANRLTLGPAAGINRVTASIEGGGSVTLSATGTASAGPLAVVSGNNQTLPTATDSTPLVVELRSSTGQPIAGATLDWSASNASFIGNITTTVTDAQGRSSNRIRILLPGAATVTAQVRGSESNRVTFALNGGVANITQLDVPQETVANAIDRLCPALAAATNLSPEEQDLLARCLELVNNAGANPGQVQDALDQFEQQVALVLADTAFGGLNAQFDNLRQRIGQVRGGRTGIDVSGLAVATSSGLMPLSFMPSIVQDADEGEGGGSDAGGDVASDFGRWGFFASGIIGRAEQDGDSRTPEYDYDTTGLTVGVDFRANDAWVVGVALGYTQQDTELGDGRGDVDAKGWSISGYSSWYNANNWYLDGVLSIGSNDYDLRRSIVYQIVGSGGGTTQVDQVARASTGGDQWLASISGGRDFQKGAWSFGPYLRASLQNVEFDSYEEDLEAGPGSGLGLAVESRKLESMTGVVGGKVSYAMSRDWGILLPYAQVEWEHEFEDDPQQVAARFLFDPTGTLIVLEGSERDTDYFNIGVGLSAVFAGGRSGFIYYERTAGAEGLSQDNLSLGVRIEF
jgi:outer membrane autotransporter protein